MKPSFKPKYYLLFLTLGIVFSFQSCINKVDSTEDLLNAIEKKYEGKWFKQVKFLQTTNFYRDDSIVKSERWIEEYVYPGQLIIKVDQDSSNQGYLYRNDSVYIFENNGVIHRDAVQHDLVILSMDIYNMSAEESLRRFDELDYDIEKFHTKEHNGRKVYIVGAEKGDSSSNQVWFDAEHLYFVKMIKNNEYGKQEVVFNDYININGNAWIEQEVVFYLDGKKYMEEKYYNIHVPDNKRKSLDVDDFTGFKLSLINPLEALIEYQIDYLFQSIDINQMGDL